MKNTFFFLNIFWGDFFYFFRTKDEKDEKYWLPMPKKKEEDGVVERPYPRVFYFQMARRVGSHRDLNS
jgi:hypothetical protein